MASHERTKTVQFVGFLQIFVLTSSLLPCCSSIMSAASTRRQATVSNGPPNAGFLATDLLPPLSLRQFPTLRPRRPAPPIPAQNPPQAPTGELSRDLVPPAFIPSSPVAQRSPQNGPNRPNQFAPSPSPTAEPLPLLPPIEIPPERPLTDAEILETLPPKETSFIPTTGQGLATIAASLTIPDTAAPSKPEVVPISPSPSVPSTPVAVSNPGVIPVLAVAPTSNTASNSSVVRFPTEAELSAAPPSKICPVCECTNEVDYICASNGVLYLNSCSFDCATFCDAGLRKVELQACASKNPN